MNVQWKMFNIFIRFVGWWFLIGGVFGLLSWKIEFYKHFNGKSEWIVDATIGVIGIFAFVFVSIAGYAFLKAKPYNPNSYSE